MIELQLGGERYSGFTSASVTRSVATLAGNFSIALTAQQGRSFPVKLGSAAKIFVDGSQVIEGFVETIDVDYDVESHTIQVGGRDRTADFIDSSVGVVTGILRGLSLEALVRRTLDGMGLSDIEVISEAFAGPFDAFELEPMFDQTGAEFIEPFTRARAILATTDGQGNIVLTRAGSDTAPGAIRNKIGGKDNTVLSGSLSLDETERFAAYTVKSEDVFSREKEGDFDIAAGTDISSTVTDSEIRSERRIAFEAEENLTTIQEANDRAVWESNIRRAQSKRAEFVVQGYSVNGALWVPNQRVAVDDDFLDITSEMLIESVTYALSLSGGSTTSLVCVPPDSYQLAAERDAVSARLEVLGGDFF